MVHFHFIRKQLKVFFSLALVIYVLSVARRQYVEEPKGTSQYRRRNRTDADEGQVTRHEVLWGTLNVHRWNSLCGYTVDNLRDCQSFPKVPNFRSSVNILEFSSNSKNFGQRIFGYIHPPKSGLYQFSISSDDFSELWLSSDENPNNASLVSYIGGRDKQKGTFELGWTRRTEFNKYESQTSRDIELCEGKWVAGAMAVFSTC